MNVSLKLDSMRKRAAVIALLAISLSNCHNPASAADPSLPKQSDGKPVTMVVHIDSLPLYAKPTEELLKNYRDASMKEPGAKKIEIFQQIGRGNHFTLVEQWQTLNAYNAHVGTKNSRDFRSSLQPMLGSPFDERPHYTL